jgi:nucleoside-diphosphate-sugar epimerase
MRYLITGHRGFVGSRLHKKLPDALVIDSKDGQNLLNCSLPEGVDVVYHLAAHKSVEESWQNPLLYAENLAVTMRLVDKYPNAKIIHASSCASLDPETSPYAFFKDAASRYLKSFSENTVDLLFPNIFGGQQKQNSVVDIFKNAETITVHDPSVVRDYVHVDDIVEGLLKAAEWPTGTYMMGSGIGTSTLALAEATGKPIVNTNTPRSKEPPESIVPNSTPNWIPSLNVYEYLAS